MKMLVLPREVHFGVAGWVSPGGSSSVADFLLLQVVPSTYSLHLGEDVPCAVVSGPWHPTGDSCR